MTIKKNITTLITWLVAVVIGIVVIILPLCFFLLSYQNTVGMLETEAEMNADIITHIVSSNPDLWEFEHIRLTEYLIRRPKSGVEELRRIVNTKNEIVSESADDLQPPLIMRSSKIMDSGITVARIEIYRSLLPLLGKTGLVFLLVLPLGLGVFYVLRTMPIRTILLAETVLLKTNCDLDTTNKLLQEEIVKCKKIEAELFKLNEELETRVVERTLQLETQIDEQMKAERALAESEEKYRNFMEESPIGICIADLSGRVQFINRKIEETTGWTRDELLSRDALTAGFFDEETKRRLLERLAARLSGDAPRTTEIPVTCKDGSRLWVDLKATFAYKDGLPSALQLAFVNITERRRAEEALRESENKYRLLIENSSDLFFTISFRGHFIYVNPVAERIMGWPISEIVGKHYLSFVIPDFHEEIVAFYKKQYDEHIPSTYIEYPIITGDGRARWIGQNVQFFSVNGKVAGFQAVARDITERRQAEEALKESEKRYRLLADKMTDIVWILDMNLRTVYVSPSIEKTLGFSPEERMAQDVHEQLTPESMLLAQDALVREITLEQQGPADPDRHATFEWEFYHKDGSTRWIESILSGLRDDRGVVTGFHGVSRDITERRQAERELRESEKKYRELVDFLPISLLEIDLQGNIISANPAILKTFGYSQSDFEKGMNAFNQIVPDDFDRLGSHIQKLLSGREQITSEYTGVRKDGSTFPFIVFSNVIIRVDEPVGLRGAIIDLTERKRAEESLKKSNLSLAEAQRIAHIGNWELNIQNDDMYWSEEVYRIAGTTPQLFDGTFESFSDLVFPEDREMVSKAVEKAMNEGATSEIKHRIVRCDGAVRDVNQLVEPIIDDAGKIIKVIGIVQDVTEKNQAERDLQNVRDQLLQSEKLAYLGRLSAGVAHEILNPVNIISIELQILQTMEDLPPEVLEELNICMAQTSRIVAIAENLKQFSRIPEKKAILADINNVIAHVLTLYATQLKIEGIETEVQYQPDLPVIAMDKEKIEQVILNLITNAMAAMEGKETKVLRITTERETMFRDQDQLKIMFADTGTGIMSEHMSKLFDPFFTTKAQGKGTGLGLSISYGIIHDHGGRIWAENNEWGGASFYVRLPFKMDIANKSLLK